MNVPDRRVAETFVELADTLVADFDLPEFLNVLTARCVELLDVTAAGLLLAGPRGVLNVAAASSEQSRLLELFEVQTHEGACIDCFRGGAPVQCADLATARPRWPRFAQAAQDAGFHSVCALPMRLRKDIIGALNLFRDTSGRLDDDELAVGQALADVATIGLLNERNFRRNEVLVGQLQGALDSRVVIEQAKGMLATRRRVSLDEAFAALRDHARSHNRRLFDVALAVVASSPEAADLLG